MAFRSRAIMDRSSSKVWHTMSAFNVRMQAYCLISPFSLLLPTSALSG